MTATGASPKRRSAGPLLTLETTVFPITVGELTVVDNAVSARVVELDVGR